MQTSGHVVVSYSDTEIDYHFAFLTIEEDKVHLSFFICNWISKTLNLTISYAKLSLLKKSDFKNNILQKLRVKIDKRKFTREILRVLIFFFINNFLYSSSTSRSFIQNFKLDYRIKHAVLFQRISRILHAIPRYTIGNNIAVVQIYIVLIPPRMQFLHPEFMHRREWASTCSLQ